MEFGVNLQQPTNVNQNSNIGSNETKGNCVMLVCIHNVSGTIITHELLYKIFSPFGKILRILIFDKNQIWKSFVEFSTPESALEAKNRMNNLILFSDGSKISIYPSNLNTIKFQKNNPGGVDYTVLDNLNIYGLKDRSSTIQEPRIGGSHEQNSQIPLPVQAFRFDPFADQNQVYLTQTPGFLANQIAEEDSESRDLEDEPKKKLHIEGKEKEAEVEVGLDEAEKEFNALIASTFKPASKAQVTHIHSVPAQLYRDNPLLQQPKTTIPENLTTESSLPPGLPISQYNFSPQNSALMKDPTIISRKSVSMNFIPLPEIPQSSGNFLLNQNALGTPMAQLPQSASMNSLPLVMPPHNVLPSFGPQGGGAFIPMGQRSLINRSFLSQPEIPLMGDRINPALIQRNMTYFPDPNTHNISGAVSETSIIQPGTDSFEYAGLTNMNRSTLSQLHDNLTMLLGKGDESKKSKVLYVKGLENKNIKVQMLYNIFSNFGNILKIIFIPSKSAALLEFENADYSTICMDYLNNVIFMNKPLRIFYSKYSNINLKNKKAEDPAEEVFVGNPKTFRFKKNKNVSINPPSSTLHLSNLMKEICTEDTIRTYFAAYGRVEAIKFIFMENNKNMCLVRMSSIEESLNAMACLHDTDLAGRKIQISFTRSRI